MSTTDSFVADDTIVALATPPGRGGIGVIRISGPEVKRLAQQTLQCCPSPRYASYLPFYDQKGDLLDQGIAIYFPAPRSFTGEDVLELQGHGGPVLLDYLLKQIIEGGARLALPGEFSQRAYLNGKCDLTQAEAIADLINSSSLQAARGAMRSLTGVFSEKISKLKDDLIYLRTYVEAALDFPDEDTDLLQDHHFKTRVKTLSEQIMFIQSQAKQGVLLQEGIHCVIAGIPNAGKSSLLNALTQKETAIVSEMAGTTRDIIRDNIQINGIPMHVIDTAGLRHSDDQVEQEGVRRALDVISQADVIVLVADVRTFNEDINSKYYQRILKQADEVPVILVKSKIDLSTESAGVVNAEGLCTVLLSVKDNLGMDVFKDTLAKKIGFDNTVENDFIARRRHLLALDDTQQQLQKALYYLEQGVGDIAAECLRQAQQALAAITGEFGSDDLLGEIFSSFCIGK